MLEPFQTILRAGFSIVFAASFLFGCGGPDSPFRVGELAPLDVDSDLDALHQKDPRIPLPSSAQMPVPDADAQNPLDAPRSYLTAASGKAADNAQPRSSNPSPEDRPRIALSLPQTVLLGLRRNRSIRSQYLGRVTEQFSLYVAEEQFVPRWQTITGSATIQGGQGSESGTASLGTDFTWETPFGTNFGLGWNLDQTYSSAADTDASADSTVSLTVTQPLLRGAEKDVNTAELRLARITGLQDRLSLQSSVTATVSELTTAYFTYVREERNVEIERRNLERSRQLLKSNNRLVAAGRMAPNDVVQTRLSVSNGELALQEALNSLDTARLALLNRLSMDPRLQLDPNIELKPRLVKVDLDTARMVAYRNNPDYRSVRLNIDTAEIDLLLARDNLRWQLDVTGSYNLTGTGSRPGRAINDIVRERGLWGAGLNLSIPIDLRDLRAAEVSAEVALEQAKLNETDARENLDTRVRDAVRNVSDRWQRLQLSRRSVDLAQRTLDAEMKKLAVGKSTNFEVLARHLTLQEAEVSELNAVIDYLLTLVALDQALGTTLSTWQIALNDNHRI